MRSNFRKVPIQRLEENFYSLRAISLLRLRFGLLLSSLDNNSDKLALCQLDVETQNSLAKG
jgi:hypothetical protein